jgi:Ca-activated chloride channel family protein
MRFLVVLAIVFPCLAQNAVHFRVEVPLVNVAFSVRDSSGVLIPNLTQDDFEVLDDGVPQTISYFAHSADVRLTLGLIADMSGSQDRFVKRHRHDLDQFLKEVLDARDQAFLICFGNHIRLASDLTSSGQDVMEGLDRFNRGMHGMPELAPDETRDLGTAFYDALYYATTEKLTRAEGSRKALIVFSDGEDNSSAHHMLDVIESAQRENVVIFSIRYTETKKGRLTARNKYGTRVMARLSRETGGSDFDAGQADLHQVFLQIGEELRSSYELAYHARQVPADGTFHKLVIRAKRPGLTVRTKTGYFAGDDGKLDNAAGLP